ncbi:MAG TPA: hypothetical protein VKV57_11815 [bacterium]|nr:hypothetical protein [bacterium]
MHRALLVVLDTARRDRDTVETAVAEQMATFGGDAESGGLWDSWQIGGRCTGYLSGYRPSQDKRNYSPCEFCGGKGTRPLGGTAPELDAWYAARALDSGVFPVIGKGCNGCLGTGWRWNDLLCQPPHDGDIMRHDEIDLDALLRRRRADAAELHRWLRRDRTLRPRAEREKILAMTEAEYVATVPAFSPFKAFLRYRHWIEREPLDMGLSWSIRTECERAVRTTSPASVTRRIEADTTIIIYEDADDWARQFYERFVEHLPGSTLLVVVDFHV